MSDPKPYTLEEARRVVVVLDEVDGETVVAESRLIATAQAAAEVATLKAQWLNLSAKLQETIARAVAAEASLTEALDLLAATHSDRDTHPHALKVAAFLVRHGRKP